MRASLSWLVLATCLGGCSKREPLTPERPVEPRPAPTLDAPPVSRDAPVPTLVRVDARGTHEIAPLPVTLFVAPREVVVQRGASAVLVPSQILGRFDPTAATDHLIAPLTDLLVEVLASEPARALPRPDVALVALVPDAAMGTLVDVLYSSGYAGMRSYEFVVDTDQGPRALSVLPPRRCKQPSAADDPCIRPQVLFADDGMLLSAQRIDEGDECVLPSTDPAAPWAGRNLTGPDGACPTAWDPAFTAIPWLLAELPALGRVCRHALVSAELGVPWSRLAPAFASLHAEFEHGLVIEASAPTGCIDPYPLGR